MSRSGKAWPYSPVACSWSQPVVVAAAWYYASAIGYPRQSSERRT